MLKLLQSLMNIDVPFGGPLQPVFVRGLRLFGILLPIAAVGLPLLALFIPLRHGFWLLCRRRPRLTIKAALVRKRYEPLSEERSPLFIARYAAFEAESGDLLELIVPEARYDDLSLGESGLLTFRGATLLEFTPTDDTERMTPS